MIPTSTKKCNEPKCRNINIQVFLKSTLNVHVLINLQLNLIGPAKFLQERLSWNYCLICWCFVWKADAGVFISFDVQMLHKAFS